MAKGYRELQALLPFPKPQRFIDLEFRVWISKQICVVCRTRGVLHDDGTYRNEPSHVLTRGAFHGDYDNLLPHCRIHHDNHERSPAYEKLTWKLKAKEYTQRYFNETGKERPDGILEKR